MGRSNYSPTMFVGAVGALYHTFIVCAVMFQERRIITLINFHFDIEVLGI